MTRDDESHASVRGASREFQCGATVTDRMRLRMNKADKKKGPDRPDSLPENVADMELYRQLGGA
ncbi:hypothetical protein [Microbispora sp. NPDC046933]|uniref:hypothetical protein n=1 Tax=Microbispora sp. NPDC046933 TaxID=3155618 RepID=UPI0033EC965D